MQQAAAAWLCAPAPFPKAKLQRGRPQARVWGDGGWRRLAEPAGEHDVFGAGKHAVLIDARTLVAVAIKIPPWVHHERIWRTGDLLLPIRATSSCHRCRSRLVGGTVRSSQDARSHCFLTAAVSISSVVNFVDCPSTRKRLARQDCCRKYVARARHPLSVDASSGVASALLS